LQSKLDFQAVLINRFHKSMPHVSVNLETSPHDPVNLLFVNQFSHGTYYLPRTTPTTRKGGAGLLLASQAGAVFQNPFTIKLARDSEITPPLSLSERPCSSNSAPRKKRLIKKRGHLQSKWSGVFEGTSSR
jgi:hypothetical protein